MKIYHSDSTEDWLNSGPVRVASFKLKDCVFS